MPKRTDIDTILVIGSGPIVIGQACEFDYSGAQACKVLKADGYRVVLVNSNPATIMTDPGLADRTYVEPITPEFVEQVIAKERPDALLPTLGGQTGLNTAVDLARAGVLDKYGVEMIGCDLEAIERGEDRKQFNECMAELGIETSRSGYAYSIAGAETIVAELGYPVVLRPSFTLGGAGGGIAHDAAELHEIVGQGLELSPAGEVLVEERPRERIFLCPPPPEGMSDEESESFAYEYAAGKGIHAGYPAGVLATPSGGGWVYRFYFKTGGRRGNAWKPAGRYAVAYGRSIPDDFERAWAGLHAFLASRSLRPTGSAYGELLLDELSVQDTGDYFGRLEVPVAVDSCSERGI